MLTNPKLQQCAGMIAESEDKPYFALIQFWNRAIEFFRSAFTYHPNEPFILERLGTLLLQKKIKKRP